MHSPLIAFAVLAPAVLGFGAAPSHLARRGDARRIMPNQNEGMPAPWEGEGAEARKAAIAAVFSAQEAKTGAADGADPEILKARAKEAYAGTRSAVVADHFFLGALTVGALWAVAPLRLVESYALGVAFGGAYLYLLGRFVGAIGEASLDAAKEGGVGQARFAIVALLVAVAGKQRESLDFLPLLGGFFSYQMATLLQAARPPAGPVDGKGAP